MNAPESFVLPQHAADETRPLDLAGHHEVERFYFREARLQNRHQPRVWVESMLDPEVFYWLPVLEDRHAKDNRPAPTPYDPAIYSDRHGDLLMRVERLETGMVWMEDPPTRTRFLVSNIEAYHTQDPAVTAVYCNVHLYRSRRQREEYHHFYGREDLLRRDSDGALRLYRRKIVLDQRVVLDKNLYVFL